MRLGRSAYSGYFLKASQLRLAFLFSAADSSDKHLFNVRCFHDANANFKSFSRKVCVLCFVLAVSYNLPMAKIFIIEDDVVLRTELRRILELNNYEVEIFEGDDFKKSSSAALSSNCDLLISDLKLSGFDGLKVCKEIKEENPNISILVLTSSDSEFDEIFSMHIGVDDYVTKPYSVPVLLAHIERVIKNAQPLQNEDFISCDRLKIYPSKFKIQLGDQEVDLSKNEMKILMVLTRAKGDVISRQDLMYELWQTEKFVDDNTLTVNVNRLRKTLKEIGAGDDFIKTVRGEGYRI